MDLQERMAPEQRQSSGPAPGQQVPIGSAGGPPYLADPRQAPAMWPPAVVPAQPSPPVGHTPPGTTPTAPPPVAPRVTGGPMQPLQHGTGAPNRTASPGMVHSAPPSPLQRWTTSTPPVGAPPVVTAPPPGIKRPARRYALPVTLLVGALLVIAAVMPLLQSLLPTTPPLNGRVPPVASSTPNAQGTPNPAAFAWLGNLRAYAERKYVDGLIAKMTLDEEIGQMLQVSFYGNGTPMLAPEQWMLDEIAQYHIGSVILYNANLSTAQSARDWAQQLQAQAKIPLLIGTDEEGGTVNRLQAIDGYVPAAAEMAAHADPATYAKDEGKKVAQLLTDLGMNNDYAPVVDVQSIANPAGGELGGRMFGSTPQQVTQLAGAFLSGLQESHQVVGTLKHFPGLGGVPVDPHQVLYTVTRGLSDLWKTDWAPYKALIASGQVEMIMSTHVIIKAVDPTRPATLSKKVITGILRQQMHYNGVIITDAVYMLGREGAASFTDAVREAVEAGNDIISAITSLDQAEAALQELSNSVKSGAISKQRIDDSVRRILLLKLRYGVLTTPPTASQP
jgi:beta-N-acetylhexosaminidase